MIKASGTARIINSKIAAPANSIKAIIPNIIVKVKETPNLDLYCPFITVGGTHKIILSIKITIKININITRIAFIVVLIANTCSSVKSD